MRVTMLTVGTRGDVQPVVALGSELAVRGHDVVVATHETFREFVEGRGLGFAHLPGDPRAELESPEGRRLVSTGASLVRFIRRFLDLLEPWFDDLTKAASEACRGADVIVYSPLAFVGWHLAEASGVPAVMMALQPFEPTSAWSTVTLGGRHLGGPLNRLTHHAGRQLAWQPLRGPVRRWRRSLGLPPGSWLGPYRRLRRERHLQLYGFSPTVVPPPPDWPDHVVVTGYWFLDEPPDWQPPAELAAFLDAGPEPVYVGFGSMSGTEAATEAAVRAVRTLGRRAVVSGTGVRDASDVFATPDVPHSWLLPRVAGAIHHGGAGTTAAMLRAGVPSVVVPGYADQPFWARRVRALGAGPSPVPLADVTERDLIRAVRSLGDHGAGARATAAALAGEDGAAAAAGWIESAGS